MSDFIEDMGLHAEGFSDAQIAEINAIEPDVAALVAALKAQMPRIIRVIPVIQMALAVFEQHQKETSQ